MVAELCMSAFVFYELVAQHWPGMSLAVSTKPGECNQSLLKHPRSGRKTQSLILEDEFGLLVALTGNAVTNCLFYIG